MKYKWFSPKTKKGGLALYRKGRHQGQHLVHGPHRAPFPWCTADCTLCTVCGAGMHMQLGASFTLIGKKYVVGVQFPVPVGPPKVYLPKLALSFGMYFRNDDTLNGKE